MIGRYVKISAAVIIAGFVLAGCNSSSDGAAAAAPTSTTPPPPPPPPPPTSGTVTLSWTPPTQNDDGSPLLDLAGYNIYYGVEQGNYPTKIPIDNPGLATYMVVDLEPNTYYFVATSENSAGIESAYSNVAVKTVN